MKKIPVKHIASTNKEQSNKGRFSIRKLSEILKGKELVQELHKHDFYFVLALEKGAGVHEIDFISYNIHNYAVFFLRPGQVHQLQLAAKCTGYLLEFDNLFYQPKNSITAQRWKKVTSKNYCTIDSIRFKKLLSFLTNIFTEHTEKQEGFIEAIKANLDLFFIEYVRQSKNPTQISSATNTYTQERYEDLLRLLELNITKMKNASQYAGLLNLSSYQLNSITKTAVGKTVSELINEQIILEAKRYLLATPNQVKEIADHLGYEDFSYFIRFFKKHTGYSPEAFRKNFK